MIISQVSYRTNGPLVCLAHLSRMLTGELIGECQTTRTQDNSDPKFLGRLGPKPFRTQDESDPNLFGPKTNRTHNDGRYTDEISPGTERVVARMTLVITKDSLKDSVFKIHRIICLRSCSCHLHERNIHSCSTVSKHTLYMKHKNAKFIVLSIFQSVCSIKMHCQSSIMFEKTFPLLYNNMYCMPHTR